MATAYGMLTSFDSDRQFVSTVGQSVVYDEITTLLERHNELQREMLAVFVDRRTEDHQIRYKSPIGGEMQTMGRQAAAGAVKQVGEWDVAFPLIQIGDRLATDRVDAGYLTAGTLEAQLRSIMDRDTNAVRRSMLASIFYNQTRVFLDPVWGNLNIQPLANNDATIYPPIIGAAAGAIDNHYLIAAALNAVSMNAAYNELIEHYGQRQRGDNVICFCDQASALVIAGLAGYVAAIDRFIDPGIVPQDVRAVPYAPGITVGRWNSVWVNEWPWMPANYVLFVHLDAEKPLYMREDPSDTGLPAGLTLVQTDTEHPITNAHYEHRYGFGVANRLNGVVLEIGAGAAYAVPAFYNTFRYAAA